MRTVPGHTPTDSHTTACASVALNDPQRFSLAAEGADFNEFVGSLWSRIGDEFPVEERVQPVGIDVHKHTLPSREIVVVVLPKPEHGAESYFVALVVEANGSARYFTLEHSWNLDDSPRTVLGEWVADRHYNLGTGPDPTEAGFVEAVSRILS